MRSPLHDLEVECGAVFSSCRGREIAEIFGDAKEESQAVRNGCGALDLFYAGKLKVGGRDRVRY